MQGKINPVVLRRDVEIAIRGAGYKGELEDVVKNLKAPDGLSNEETKEWFDDQELIYNFMVAETGKKYYTKLADNLKKTIQEEYNCEVNPGSNKNVIEGALFNVNLKVSNPSVRLDADKFEFNLRTLGVDPYVIEKAKAGALKESAPAKTYSIQLKD